MIDDFGLERLVSPLLNWYQDNARTLPWREDATPYRVWVSEIMLQQTRVEAVKPYFVRFMDALPDAASLAACPEDQLLKLWEGLGYYNRVRNMQKAAIEVMEQYDGVLPADYEKLLKLKGIGSYTAGAIASIAYGIPVPAVDGNVFRVLTRVTADDTDIMKASFRKKVESELLAMMGKQAGTFSPGAWNQALMELGATVCLPNGAPLCEKCPWRGLCLAKAEGRIEELPVRSKTKPRKIEKRTVLVIRDGDKVAIHKRPKKGLLAGLYELPNVEGELTQEEVLSLVKEMKFAPIRIQKLADAKHIFSHIEWQMTGYAIRVEEAGFSEREMAEENLIFVDATDARERYAIPSAFAVYAEYMDIRLGIS